MKNDMTIIITMAGAGSRFRKVGYTCPKYMIEVRGKTLFEWSMDSLMDYNSHVEKYVFVVQKDDNSKDFIIDCMQKYGINKIDIIEIEQITDGQATTCMLALEKCNLEHPIMIYNIDTYIEPYVMKYDDISGDGYIPCFCADGDHWSFVKADEMGKVVEVREKERISDNCSIGAYYFSSAKLYKRIYEEYYANEENIEKKEKYIAPLYNYMIRNGFDVSYSLLEKEKVHVLGTPSEVEKFLIYA